jgi:hypothetical protein
MPDAAALDKQILDASITNAALEILPETLASMAILPLQVRLVYRIGKPTATSSTRATSRSSSRRSASGSPASTSSSSAASCSAASWARCSAEWVAPPATRRRAPGWRSRRRGRSARSRSSTTAAGRTLDSDKLKAAFAPLLAQGQALVDRYGGDIAQRARTIDVRNLPALIKGL